MMRFATIILSFAAILTGAADVNIAKARHAVLTLFRMLFGPLPHPCPCGKTGVQHITAGIKILPLKK